MRTLCFTGMDRAEEAKLKALFSDANEWLGGDWMLMPEAQAEVLVVDLESMYGHMTWLKMHNSGKYVIALTTRGDTIRSNPAPMKRARSISSTPLENWSAAG